MFRPIAFQKNMKHVVLTVLIAVLAVGLLLAQGTQVPGNSWRRYNSPYDLKTPPPLAMSDAFALTQIYIQAHMGTATNCLYCISASCVDMTKRGLPGWTFYFSNTNGQRIYMEVSFDREVSTLLGDTVHYPK
jgi:hypothetical protein